ncbi:MAG: sulfite exporter TauE/SafE family protein [Candidatus Korobacteraceae bacterium]
MPHSTAEALGYHLSSRVEGTGRTVNHTFLLTLAGVVAGAIAAISGFGIGSILTPLLAAWIGTKLAVAVVSIPHFVGTALRFVVIREHVDRRVLWSFGVTSAVGGLVGAVLHIWLRSGVLGYVLGALLVFAGVTGVTGLAARMKFGRRAGWIAGALSGMFGGLVGNQGGIRSAALLGFGLQRDAFVATATAIALLVDVFRMPVYAALQFREIVAQWPMAAIATVGVVVGTLSGKWMLQRIPQNVFRLIVSSIVLALGVWMLIHPGS